MCLTSSTDVRTCVVSAYLKRQPSSSRNAYFTVCSIKINKLNKGEISQIKLENEGVKC